VTATSLVENIKLSAPIRR